MHSGGKYNHQRSQETRVERAEEEGKAKSRPDTMSNLHDVIGNTERQFGIANPPSVHIYGLLDKARVPGEKPGRSPSWSQTWDLWTLRIIEHFII